MSKFYMSRFFLPFLLLLGVFGGCKQEPSPTGVDLLPPGDLTRIVVFNSTDSNVAIRTSTFFKPIPAANSSLLSLGKTKEYSARILLRWLNFPSDIGEKGSIVSAKVKLFRSPYHIGNQSSQFGFDVKEITSPWSSYTFTSDSTPVVMATPSGTFSGTVGDSIEIDLDTTLVRSWLKKMADGRFTEIRGVLLDPTSGTDFVQAFEAFSSDYSLHNPQLTFVMNLGGSTDSTLTAGAIENTYTATGPSLTNASLALHGGLAYRAKLFIDVSAIPAGSIINNVELYLHIDRSASRNYYRNGDSVLVYELADSTKDSLTTNSIVSKQTSETDMIMAQGISLVRAVQHWVNDKSRNHGLMLIKVGEVSDLDLTQFYGVEASAESRPKLIVTYTKQP